MGEKRGEGRGEREKGRGEREEGRGRRVGRGGEKRGWEEGVGRGEDGGRVNMPYPYHKKAME